MSTNRNLISQMDLANIKRLAQMIKVLNDELVFVNQETRTEAIGRATPALIERAFTNYDD